MLGKQFFGKRQRNEQKKKTHTQAQAHTDVHTGHPNTHSSEETHTQLQN